MVTANPAPARSAAMASDEPYRPFASGDSPSSTRRTVRSSLTRVVVAMVLAGGALAVTGPSAGAQPAPNGHVKPAIGGAFHWIRNSGNSNLCLEPQGLSTDAGAPIVQEPCATTGTESIAQGWEADKVGTNHYKFRNQLSGLCLNANQLVNGGAVFQWPCASISNQEFNAGTSLPAVAKIESRIHFNDSGFCIDEPGAQGTLGLAVQLWRCNGTPAQIWVNGF